MKCFLKIIVDSIVIVTYCCKFRPLRYALFVVLRYNGTFEKLTEKQPRRQFFALNLINLHSPNIIERIPQFPEKPKWLSVHRSNWPREAHQYYQGVGNVDPSYNFLLLKTCKKPYQNRKHRTCFFLNFLRRYRMNYENFIRWCCFIWTKCTVKRRKL